MSDNGSASHLPNVHILDDSKYVFVDHHVSTNDEATEELKLHFRTEFIRMSFSSGCTPESSYLERPVTHARRKLPLEPIKDATIVVSDQVELGLPSVQETAAIPGVDDVLLETHSNHLVAPFGDRGFD